MPRFLESLLDRWEALPGSEDVRILLLFGLALLAALLIGYLALCLLDILRARAAGADAYWPDQSKLSARSGTQIVFLIFLGLAVRVMVRGETITSTERYWLTALLVLVFFLVFGVPGLSSLRQTTRKGRLR